MTDNAELRLKNPSHTGAFVETDIIDPLNLSVADAAEVLGITRAALSFFLNGRSSFSTDMTLWIEKAFGMSMNAPMRMHSSFDIGRAHTRAGEINVARFVPTPKTERQPGLFEG